MPAQVAGPEAAQALLQVPEVLREQPPAPLDDDFQSGQQLRGGDLVKRARPGAERRTGGPRRRVMAAGARTQPRCSPPQTVLLIDATTMTPSCRAASDAGRRAVSVSGRMVSSATTTQPEAAAAAATASLVAGGITAPVGL